MLMKEAIEETAKRLSEMPREELVKEIQECARILNEAYEERQKSLTIKE